MKRAASVFTLIAAVLMVGTVARAQSSTSPQGAAAINTAAVCGSYSSSPGPDTTALQPCTDSSNNGQWFTVMSANIKTSNTTDLFISPSLVTGLYTNTQVKGKTSGTPSSETAAATGSVAVRVLLDCTNCAPADGTPQSTTANFTTAGQPDPNGTGIVYDARIQQLTATLGQAITNTCLDLTSLTNTCPPEEIDLILSTTSAHTFNFIMLNVGNGQHTITVQARLNAGQVCTNNNANGSGGVTCTNVNTTLGSSVAAALFGLGSVTVIPVHLGPGFSF